APHWVGVTPAVDTAFAIGDTLQFAVTAKDDRGAALLDPTIGWTSTDPAVAAVDGAGAVVARGPGVARIVAAVGGRAARGTVIVAPRPAGLRLRGDSVIRLAEEARLRLSADVMDARGHPIAGLSPRWHSDDPAIAAVDSTGGLVGVSAGSATITATHGELAAGARVEVVAVPGSITVTSGDGQHAAAGRELPTAVAVQVVSRRGRPMAGVPVRFAAVGGDGTTTPEVDTSDLQGVASARWTLGPRPGRQRVAVTVDGAGAAAEVVAEADPVPANTRIVLLADSLVGRVGDSLARPVLVRVTDSTGAPLADVPVAWSTSRDGRIQGLTPRTDSLGEARARWTLGRLAGPQEAWVHVGHRRTVPPVRVTALARPGRAVELVVVTGRPKGRGGPTAAPRAPRGGEAGIVAEGTVGEELAGSIVLAALDALGNPVPAAAVELAPLAGAVPEAIARTDSSGRLALRWALGSTAGIQRLAARLAGAPEGVELAVRAKPGAPVGVRVVGLPAAAPAGKPLAKPVTIEVEDAHGNPVPGASVALSASGGKVAPARLMTDGQGRAAARWTLGAKAGEQTIVVVVGKGAVRARVSVRAIAVVGKRR
ncbi:MAG TPA: Ig-like domain-containing protein, partial [Gemmatimonadales bacterium]|nr:Ig-like domain-containing protein [Gemmatimonadales bacterium]